MWSWMSLSVLPCDRLVSCPVCTLPFTLWQLGKALPHHDPKLDKHKKMDSWIKPCHSALYSVGNRMNLKSLRSLCSLLLLYLCLKSKALFHSSGFQMISQSEPCNSENLKTGVYLSMFKWNNANNIMLHVFMLMSLYSVFFWWKTTNWLWKNKEKLCKIVINPSLWKLKRYRAPYLQLAWTPIP